MKNKKILLWAVVIVVIAVVFMVVGKKAGWFGNDFSVKVATKVAEKKTITELITANGKIQPEKEVKISPDVSGEIIDLYVEDGDPVKTGDLLMIIKPDIYISSLNRAEAALNSSKARLAQAEAQQIEKELAFNRTKQLYEKDAIASSEFESAQAEYKVALSEVNAAQFSVKSAEASVSEANENLVKTKIYAPITGTVSALNVEKGERVVGTNMYAGTEMMVVADLERMEVQVEVNENDIVKVRKSDTALVEVDAYLNRKFKGVVTEIANSAKVSGSSTDQVTNFDVKILLLKDSYKDLIDSVGGNLYPFRPGMSATVDIQTETLNNVVSVPIQAVTTRIKKEGGGTEEVKDESETETASSSSTQESSSSSKKTTTKREEKQEVVFIVKDGRAWKKEVKTGIQDNTDIQILDGVSAGDEVIIAPYNVINKTLKDSMLVKIVKEDDFYNDK
jgi:HlyD family secretion protein